MAEHMQVATDNLGWPGPVVRAWRWQRHLSIRCDDHGDLHFKRCGSFGAAALSPTASAWNEELRRSSCYGDLPERSMRTP